ncbi:MAG: BamA/TamA family outer membrane protein [bacterium]
MENYKPNATVFGNGWNNLWVGLSKSQIINADSLTLIKIDTLFNKTSLIFSNKLKTRFNRFLPISNNLTNYTPKLIYTTISEQSKQDLFYSVNPYAPVIANNILTKFYKGLTKINLVQFKDKGLVADSSDIIAGYWIEANNDSNTCSKNAKNTEELLKYCDINPNEQINSSELLKYRLLDLFMGNNNVSSNNIMFTKTNNIWNPVIDEKINSFPKFDGLFGLTGKLLVPSFNSFSDDYQSPENMTWKNRYLDKRVLTQISKTVWDSTANYIAELLSDSLLLNSVNGLPLEVQNYLNQNLITDLLLRKKEFLKFSENYYAYINKYAEFNGSSLNDSISIKRVSDNITELEIFYNKEDIKNGRIVRKVFDNEITKEIRVYLGEGNDYCKITGAVNASPIIKIIGNEGDDLLIDSSVVYGYYVYIIPLENDENKTYFFDSDDGTKITKAAGTVVNPKSLKNYITLDEKYDTESRDVGHEWTFYPILEINTEEGLVTGGGPVLRKYNYGLLPYDYWMRFTGIYATQPKSYKIHFEGIYNNVVPGSSLLLEFMKSELSFDKYFGYGNETEYNYHHEKLGYYKSIYELVVISAGIKTEITTYFSANIGLVYEYTDISLNNKKLLVNYKYGDYGIGEFRMFGVSGGFSLDTRDNIENPYKGFYFNINGTLYPKLYRLEFPFLKTSFDMRGYQRTNFILPTVFALRITGGGMFGKYPFLKGVFIGGKEGLRGYSRNRFAGDFGVLGQTEIRSQISNMDIIVKSKVGLHLFYDIGRVYIDGQRSNKWHTAYGAGVWVDFSDRLFTVVTTFAFSVEKPEIVFGTNFGF